MAKAVKFKNDYYLDSSNVNYKKNNLKNIVDSILSNPIGEFVLWEGEKEIIENGNWQFIAMHYSLKEAINSKFPIKDGYNRNFKLCMESTDNIGITNGYKYVKFSQNSYTKEYLFTNIWGDITSGVKAFQSLDFDYNNLPNGHISIEITPSFEAGGSTIRIYKLYLLIYDTIE